MQKAILPCRVKGKFHKTMTNKTCFRNDAVTEVLNQAKSGSLPKLLHVDANWELNPLKELEPPSDDDLIDDTLDSRYEIPVLPLIIDIYLVNLDVT